MISKAFELLFLTKFVRKTNKVIAIQVNPSNELIQWLPNNQMKVNPDKYHFTRALMRVLTFVPV